LSERRYVVYIFLRARYPRLGAPLREELESLLSSLDICYVGIALRRQNAVRSVYSAHHSLWKMAGNSRVITT